MNKGNEESEDYERSMMRSQWLSRKIFRLYEIGIKWVPIPLMLGHWYGVWDYGH